MNSRRFVVDKFFLLFSRKRLLGEKNVVYLQANRDACHPMGTRTASSRLEPFRSADVLELVYFSLARDKVHSRVSFPN